ncbi:uncharacterized protein LOC142327352 [Lycorma delicatula]|uniref:uncharacterized protein LOC142327352 n=1 Tax=Lycorma delicatula TaxID=130591 RepID=UPI003F5173DD
MESQEMKDWKYSSWKFHQDMYQMLYDRMWDEVNKDDLNEKLIYAFTICFGEGYYEKEELRKITDKVKLKLLELFENSMYIRIGFTFISYKLVNDAKTEGIQCLIWTQRTDGRELCIDLNSRTYKDWDDFIKNNVLPKCYIIYPKCGRYASHTETNIYVEKFIDLRFEKSVACSKTRKVKIALDITAGIGCAVATTALMANPVSAPILAGIILTGSYNVGSNVVKLKDISNHDGGISIKDPKSLIVIGDIVLTVAGTAAMGVGTISKQVVAGRGIFSDLLSSSSAVIKIADNVGNINKCISTVNLLFNIAVVVSKCFSNTLQHSDILYFGRILLFGFNIKLSKILLEELIRNIANYFTDVDVIGTLSSFACRGYEMVKQIRNFSKQYHIKEVIYYIFGTFSFGKPVLQISSLINDITKNVTDAIEEFKSQFKNCKKIKIECLIKVCDKLFISLSAIRKYNSQCKENIEITYGERTWKYVQTLVKYDGIDCCLDNSEYDNKINVPNEIDRIVKETLKMCSKYHSSCTYTSNQDKLLFSLIVESLSEHHLKNIFYSSMKMAYPWQISLDSLNPNLTIFNSSQFGRNLLSDGKEKQIRSVLNEHLMNVAAAAGQTVPRFPYKPELSHYQPWNDSFNFPLIQRTVRDSESAGKVSSKQAELQQLIQQLYQAEATVQMEVGEITRSQQIATEAEESLEEATNKVRMLSSDLQAAQENAAASAMRAHTAQLQLAAHDQLMFTARQRVDALSAQMVSIQAELASLQNSFTLNESLQHLEQQGRLNSMYQFQPGLNGNSNPDSVAAAAVAASAGLFAVPPGHEQQQLNSYQMYKKAEQQSSPEKKYSSLPGNLIMGKAMDSIQNRKLWN